MPQILKKEICINSCPSCNVLNIAQRRIGNRGITDNNGIQAIAHYLQKERCPDGSQMAVQHLNPARQRKSTGRPLGW